MGINNSIGVDVGGIESKVRRDSLFNNMNQNTGEGADFVILDDTLDLKVGKKATKMELLIVTLGKMNIL